jgi:hypothetical protein
MPIEIPILWPRAVIVGPRSRAVMVGPRPRAVMVGPRPRVLLKARLHGSPRFINAVESITLNSTVERYCLNVPQK